jgi:flavin-dependent dehydrogenase
VVVLDRTPLRKPWGGETFTGAIRAPLTAIGCWETFARSRHVVGYERLSAWGGEPYAESCVFQPSGALWHVDRDRFDTDLRTSVTDRADVVGAYRQLKSIGRDGRTWRLSLDRGRSVTTRYLVDATGRVRILARRLGARIETHDRLVGLTAKVAHSEARAEIRSMMIEATPFGWWYASPTPEGHVLVMLTDADLAPLDVRRRMRPVAANSVLTRLQGEQGWLPVGDAYASHDPLCGWGVHRALANGVRAADAIDSHLRTGRDAPLAGYRRHCEDQYASYVRGLVRHYSLERRWPTAPFWRRRHRLVAV